MLSAILSKMACFLSLVFPEGIYFDRKIDAFRTPKLNSIISQISTIASELKETKKGQNDFFNHLSLSAGCAYSRNLLVLLLMTT
jgi:hypothetical protein